MNMKATTFPRLVALPVLRQTYDTGETGDTIEEEVADINAADGGSLAKFALSASGSQVLRLLHSSDPRVFYAGAAKLAFECGRLTKTGFGYHGIDPQYLVRCAAALFSHSRSGPDIASEPVALKDLADMGIAIGKLIASRGRSWQGVAWKLAKFLGERAQDSQVSFAFAHLEKFADYLPTLEELLSSDDSDLSSLVFPSYPASNEAILRLGRTIAQAMLMPLERLAYSKQANSLIFGSDKDASLLVSMLAPSRAVPNSGAGFSALQKRKGDGAEAPFLAYPFAAAIVNSANIVMARKAWWKAFTKEFVTANDETFITGGPAAITRGTYIATALAIAHYNSAFTLSPSSEAAAEALTVTHNPVTGARYNMRFSDEVTKGLAHALTTPVPPIMRPTTRDSHARLRTTGEVLTALALFAPASVDAYLAGTATEAERELIQDRVKRATERFASVAPLTPIEAMKLIPDQSAAVLIGEEAVAFSDITLTKSRLKRVSTTGYGTSAQHKGASRTNDDDDA